MLDRLGVGCPITQTSMAGVQTRLLAAEVPNAGR
jgi:NAD(P)H-dependent flavin oxidoreductase YrpB (nitropropane dioxygenase family)